MKTWSLSIALCLLVHVSHAQNEFQIFAPTKDVAMLVDVSVSVRDDREGHKDAKRVIQDIVSGQGFSAARLGEKWEVEANPEMTGLFGAYLGSVAGPDTAELRPLLADGHNFLALRIGTVSTVLQGAQPGRFKGGTDPRQVIEGLIDKSYPAARDMSDKSTCFWLAMARAAATLSQSSRMGYYLFVVSDEEDDPDYRKEGPPGHTASDYKTYLDGLAKTYPETAIRAEIGRYFDFTGVNSRNVDTYRPRNDFKQVLIARFFQAGARRSSKKVSLSWYAMGVVPERVEIRRVAIPEPQVIVQEPLAYQPPDFSKSMAVQWLGGLTGEARAKRFNYARPLLVWQVMNAEAGGFDASESPEVRMDSSAKKRVKAFSNRHGGQTWQAPDDATEGEHDIVLQHGAMDGETKVSISHPSDLWMNTLAIISAVAAVLIFFLAWRSLRQESRPATAR